MSTPSARILVVDDNEIARYSKGRILRQAGFRVHEAADGAEALNAIRNEQPAVAVLDIRLPDINGFELCRRIKADPATRVIPVLQTSATYIRPSDTAAALNSGADASLTEPIDPVVLVATINALLRLRLAEAERDAQRVMLQAVLSQLPAGVVAIDAGSGQLLFSNEEARRILGDDPAAPAALPGLALRAGAEAGKEKELVITRSDGTHSLVKVKTVPVGTHDGQTSALVAVLNDISEQKALQQEREHLLLREQTARQEAERANQAKDNFLAALSHELRSPLSAILNWTAVMQSSGNLDHVSRERVRSIERSAQKQAQLIDDLLDVSRIISGKLSLNTKPLQIIEVIEASIEEVKHSADVKQLSVETDWKTLPVGVVGDSARLQQVFSNLLSNAIKFTPAGKRIKVATRVRERMVEIQISDEGIGISREFLPRIFDAFSQADVSLTRTHAGLGLGLAIVRHIVEAHGGSVSADSRGTDTGASFIVELPTMQSIESDRDFASHQNHSVTDPMPNMNHLRVLIVEDQDEVRDSVLALLQSFGAQVSAADSVAGALRLLENMEPTLVITDLAMPEEDGYGLLKHLRASSKANLRRLPVVALTAYASDRDRQRVMEAGFEGYLTKPIDVQQLAATLAKFIPTGGSR